MIDLRPMFNWTVVPPRTEFHVHVHVHVLTHCNVSAGYSWRSFLSQKIICWSVWI